ncbi:MAG: hypothetical protein ABFD45_01735 [Smithella sp.]
MKRIITCFIVVSGVLFCAFSAGAASEPRQFVEELLIAEGLDPSQERGMMQDPRVSIHQPESPTSWRFTPGKLNREKLL